MKNLLGNIGWVVFKFYANFTYICTGGKWQILASTDFEHR